MMASKRLPFKVTFFSFFFIVFLFLSQSNVDAGYSITIDPSFKQQAYLKASNTGLFRNFGHSIAISGDTLVVGAPNAGAAYVFTRSGGQWAQQAHIQASNLDYSDGFGTSVAISGDTIVVGADTEDSSATGINGDQSDNSERYSGAAYVFVRTDALWTQQAYIKASNTSYRDYFGDSVAISGDTIVVSATSEDSSASGVDGDQGDNSASSSGAAYVFTRNGTTWSQQAYLKSSNSEEGDIFGISVAISGNTIVIGARHEDSNATGVDGDQSDNSAVAAGATYVFTRNVTVWSQQAYLKASNTNCCDSFGSSVAISGDTVVVGAPGEYSNATGINGDQGNNSMQDAGAVYMYTRSNSIWSHQAYIKASNTEPADDFGLSVALSGNTLVVGALSEDSRASGINGDQGDNSAGLSGAAYVFSRSGTVWSQQAYLKATNTDAYDQFGNSVAVSENTVVVGAHYESSNAPGINGDQSDNSAQESGAAYVFNFFTFSAGLNDAWVSADAAYQGFFFTVYPGMELFFLSWFTFDSVPPDGNVTAVFGAPDQRWVTAIGTYSGDTAVLDVELTSGGVFNASDPLATQESGVGTISIVFVNCNEAVLSYDFPSLELTGEMTLTRTVPDNVALCEALNAQ